jgi:hypothetical protein
MIIKLIGGLADQKGRQSIDMRIHTVVLSYALMVLDENENSFACSGMWDS